MVNVAVTSNMLFIKKKLSFEKKEDLIEFKKKIENEALWNELIVSKFSSKVTIDEKEIRKRTKNKHRCFSLKEVTAEAEAKAPRHRPHSRQERLRPMPRPSSSPG